jgi:hypothetical protein
MFEARSLFSGHLRQVLAKPRSNTMPVDNPPQKTTTGKAPQGESVHEEILYFPFGGALPVEHIFVLNAELGTLSYVTNGTDYPRVEQQQRFSHNELYQLRPLLESFPYHCPYEMLLASFYNGTITDEEVQRWRQHLYRALDDGTWDQELRMIRNVLSRTRSKLRPLGIDVTAVLETGYILTISSSGHHIEPITDELFYFPLLDLLPKGQTLALNLTLGTLSLLANGRDTPYPALLAEQQFTAGELSVLVPVLKSYPHYCPYEVLLASFSNGNTTLTNIERSRKRLHEAQLEGFWDLEIRPVRNVLSRARGKMRPFHIEVNSIVEKGYILMRQPGRYNIRAYSGFP